MHGETLKKETVYSSETLVSIDHTLRLHIPEREITYLILCYNAKFRVCDMGDIKF